MMMTRLLAVPSELVESPTLVTQASLGGEW